MSVLFTKVHDCRACGGSGWTIKSEPDCCGNFTRHGECRGHCFIERQVEVECRNCCGIGQVEADAPKWRTARPTPQSEEAGE